MRPLGKNFNGLKTHPGYQVIGALLILMSLGGCAQTNEFTLKASAQNLKNAEISRQVAQETMSTWSLNSGLIQCGTEEVIPAMTLKDIQRMDKLTKDAKLWSEEDYRKGCFLGIGLKLTAKQIQQFVEQIISLATTAMK